MTNLMNLASSSTLNASDSTWKLLAGIWFYLSSRRRLQVILLSFVMICSGVAELVSLGAVIPFLSALTNPDDLWKTKFIQDFASIFGLSNPGQLIVPITVIFGLTTVLAGSIRLINLRLNTKVAAAIGSDLSCNVYEATLHQPYQVHVSRNSSRVINSVVTQIDYTVKALNMFLQLVTSSIISIALISGLFIINPYISLVLIVLFGSMYVVLAKTVRNELRRNGQAITDLSAKQIKSIQEGLGSIRDVLLDNNQLLYISKYKQFDTVYRQLEAKNNFLAYFPRYTFEALGMVLISCLGCAYVVYGNDSRLIIPLLGSLALAAQRLLPALQQIYSSWASLKSFNSALKDVQNLLSVHTKKPSFQINPFSLRESIGFRNVSFGYASEDPLVLKNLNFEISTGESVGIIGTTGSGKSTLTDIIMGLLPPSGGRIFLDHLDLYDPEYPERLFSWRSSIAHVPQAIYLSDTSILENIAFGVAPHEIDLNRVKKASKKAQIDGFIDSLHNGYETNVGERGVRLSGGQRQRIGIARALYKNCNILVFDEATSALDDSTESSVVDAIKTLSRSMTIIIVAHRISTVMHCDKIIKLEKGQVVGMGSPQSILGTSN